MESIFNNHPVHECSVDGSLECVDDVVARLLPFLSGSVWLFLSGDLGAGKTTFVQRLAERIGVTGPVTSPTFTVVNSCPVDGVRGVASIRRLVHLDLYRIKSAREILYLGIEAEITPESVVCVEWPELVDDDDWAYFFSVTRCPCPVRLIRVDILHDNDDAAMRRYSWRVFEREVTPG
jgi:tRNA threonylcarbamoyladenosine biosynthesis protein TsaE